MRRIWPIDASLPLDMDVTTRGEAVGISRDLRLWAKWREAREAIRSFSALAPASPELAELRAGRVPGVLAGKAQGVRRLRVIYARMVRAIAAAEGAAIKPEA